MNVVGRSRLQNSPRSKMIKVAKLWKIALFVQDWYWNAPFRGDAAPSFANASVACGSSGQPPSPSPQRQHWSMHYFLPPPFGTPLHCASSRECSSRCRALLQPKAPPTALDESWTNWEIPKSASWPSVANVWAGMSSGQQWWAGVSSDEQWSVLVFMSLVSSDKQGWAVVTTDCHRWARVSRGDRVTGGEHEQQVWAVNREHELGALRTIGWWITFMHAMYLMPYACTCEKQSRCAYKCTNTYLYTTCTCICSSSFRVVFAFSTWGFNDP